MLRYSSNYRNSVFSIENGGLSFEEHVQLIFVDHIHDRQFRLFGARYEHVKAGSLHRSPYA